MNQLGSSKGERDEGDDDGESRHGSETGGGGKGMSFDCSGKIKQEIKTEPMDHDSIKEEPMTIKEEPRSPKEEPDIKPTLPIEPIAQGDDKKKKCCKYSFEIA